MRKLYKIGDNFCNEQRNYTLIDVHKIKYASGSKPQYKFKCNICGYDCSSAYRNGKYIKELWINSSQITRGDNCSCCANKVVVPHINSIFSKRKDLIPYFKNVEDAKIYCENSNTKVELMCPDCGTTKMMLLPNFIKRGFSCPKCSDKISIGEKILYCVLDNLNVDFVKELSNTTFDWCGKYRYDFYIKNTNTIIEVNGKQHYKGDGFSSYHGGKTVDDEIVNDKIKFTLAMEHGVKNYIIIDASKSDFNYIKHSILSSDLQKIYDLSNINWDIILKQTTSSLVKKICNSWSNDENITMDDIAELYHLSKNTIRKYLKVGNDIGWCHYDGTTINTSHYNMPYHDDAPETSNPIMCINNNIYFKSIGLCSKNSNNIFGKHMNDSSIRFRLNNNNPKSRKNNFDFKYITKQDFNEAIKSGLECYGSPFLFI